MPVVIVHPHGHRWAVATADSSSPTREFETRDAAISSARALAAGGDVEVLTEEPGTLGASHDGTEPSRDTAAGPPTDGLSEREHLRTGQGGL
jgi:hypothetical protein